MKRIFILFSLIAILFLYAGVMSSVTIASKIDNYSHSHNYVKMHLQQSNYEVFEVNNQLHSSYYYLKTRPFKVNRDSILILHWSCQSDSNWHYKQPIVV